MSMKNRIGILGAVTFLLCGGHLARAQQVTANGAITLPEDVRQVLSIDAHNILLVETEDADDPTDREYSPLTVLHIYSGGIARLLGGTVIPTEMFVSPVFNKGGFGSGNPSGITSIGGFNSGGLSQILNRLDRAPQQVEVSQ